jgi:hypothetical protein
MLAQVNIGHGYGSGSIFLRNGIKYMYISPYYKRATAYLKWDPDVGMGF